MKNEILMKSAGLNEEAVALANAVVENFKETLI